MKFLGVLLDETLSWKFHLIELSTKWSRSVGIFYKLRHFVPKELLKTVFYSLFIFFLSYSIVVWGATHEKYLKPVFIFQKKAMRAIITFSGPIAHTPPLFLDLQIFKLEDILYLHFFFAYECVNGIAQFILGLILLGSLNFINIIPEVPPVVTFFLLEKIQCNMAYGSICFNGVKSWNSTPSDIRNSPSVSIFKIKIKNFLLD